MIERSILCFYSLLTGKLSITKKNNRRAKKKIEIEKEAKE